ncbi:dimethyl sulfoxide reductase anchor subunit family protein [Uliginosibacterium sp. sgz301328]|uniref:dimethyl sulfoxide reductase anchor subunit family protein n=1 Tax=Uliginosibacterium sp. sgz301328 TaxID=3243764 RepID=UPI00359F12EA
MMHDWPLVFFTVLTQTAIGTLCVATVFGLMLGRNSGADERFHLMRRPLLAASGLSVLGLALSFLHLGYPLNAINAIRNISTSWMAREIVLTSAFIGATCLTTFLAMRQRRVANLHLIVCAALGIANLLVMAEIYRHTSVATWLPVNTHFAFIGTALTGGSLVAWLCVAPAASQQDARQFGIVAMLCVVAAILLQLLALPLFISELNQVAANPVVTFPLRSLTAYAQLGDMRCVRWALSIVGGALFCLAMWRLRDDTRKPMGTIVSAAALLACGELVGRYLFYAVYG